MIRSLKALLIALTVPALASPALAQNPKVNVQVFRPSPHHDDLFTVKNTNIGEHLRWSAALFANFGKNPLVFVDSATSARAETIQDQLTLDIMGSISLFERVSIGLDVPLFVLNGGDDQNLPGVDASAIESFAIGDIRLSPKVGILSRADADADGFGVAAELEVNIPTGNAESFVSDGFTLTPRILADFKTGPFLVALNVGFRVRIDEQTLPFNTEVGHEFIWSVGARYDIIPELLQVIGEVYGASADYTTANNTHIEGVLGGRLHVPDTGLAFTLGGGSGFTKGYGNTKFRIFAGARFSPEVIVDQDLDGILDDVDKCPVEPEDADGFEDDDGCPDTDNDGDGIPDVSDKCPNDAEDKDGFEDEDGCPDMDNDGDGLADTDDKCVNEPEDKDDFQDDDGCPDPDNDGDGILDVNDACPNQPETMNGHEDEDGCPDETLAKIEKGKIIILDKIYFDTGKATIKPESFPVLKAVSGILKANPHVQKVSVHGHTDDRGSKRSNLKLSQARAESVQAWLTGDGIDGARLSATGHGEDAPAMQGKTKEAREKNRRVEFLIDEQ